MLTDTHAHLHHHGLENRVNEVLANAAAAGVTTIINVGVTAEDSRQSVALAQKYDNMFATVGLHPHDAEFEHSPTSIQALDELANDSKVVAIGECGLDYSRANKGQKVQEPVFRGQIDIALKHDLPMVWHIRDAFDDFFEIIDDYADVRGVVHCFTSTKANMNKAVERGFFIALNGIMTFTKDASQLEAARAVPLESLLLETDCPFLAPVPLRGKTNEPAYLRKTAEFLATLRDENLENLARATTANADKLFRLKA